MRMRLTDAGGEFRSATEDFTSCSSPQAAPGSQFAAIREVQEKIGASKRSYVTRRLDLKRAERLIATGCKPQSGDVVLCVVVEIGQHGHLELVTGRRSKLFVGDTIIVAYGERYATDQFHAVLPADLSACSLAAAGGIAAEIVGKHSGVRRATRIEPIGVLASRDGKPINIASAALTLVPGVKPARKPIVVTVLGTAMNAGKTTTAANIIKSLRKQNLKVGAVKLTGTGSGGDCWLFRDAGADPVLDFTDAGFASTYNAPIEALEQAGRVLFAALAAEEPDFIVCEIADGLLQQETLALLRSSFLKEATDSVVFAAGDAISAAAGVHILGAHGFLAAAISGVVSASPLAAAEVSRATGLPVLTQEDLLGPAGGASAFLLPSRRAGAAT